MGGRVGRFAPVGIGFAVGLALLVNLAVAPAGAAGTLAKHYVAAGGGPVLKDSPAASCSNDGITPSVGGACFTVTGPTVVHASIRDVASGVVAAYAEVDDVSLGFFCTATDVVVPDGTHEIGVWVGGADAAAAGCSGPGQATTGWIFLTPTP